MGKCSIRDYSDLSASCASHSAISAVKSSKSPPSRSPCRVRREEYNHSKLQPADSSRQLFNQKSGRHLVLTSGMAIVGTGVDICEVARVRDAIERFGERFLKRVFTAAEREYCNSKRNRIERYA